MVLGSDNMATHICRPIVDVIQIDRGYCPNCAKRRFVLRWHQEWYGWNETCLRCGEQWQDGQRLERPFCPGWRKLRVARAKQLWRRYREGRPDR
jgi:hypothetical protein